MHVLIAERSKSYMEKFKKFALNFVNLSACRAGL